jgi:hypothetical protein
MLVYFMAIRSILRPFVIFCSNLVQFMVIWHLFSPFWYVVPRKIWQHWPEVSVLTNERNIGPTTWEVSIRAYGSNPNIFLRKQMALPPRRRQSFHIWSIHGVTRTDVAFEYLREICRSILTRVTRLVFFQNCPKMCKAQARFFKLTNSFIP